MMDWFPLIGLIGIWLIFLVLAYLVYKDAENRGMNGLLWAILILLPWIGIIFLLAYLVARKNKSPVWQEKTAKGILDERYARGELTTEEYLRMRDDLMAGRHRKDERKDD
jgi:putative membrane protein